jgi:hypothetical protein
MSAEVHPLIAGRATIPMLEISIERRVKVVFPDILRSLTTRHSDPKGG